jgi:hypothetical protein
MPLPPFAGFRPYTQGRLSVPAEISRVLRTIVRIWLTASDSIIRLLFEGPSHDQSISTIDAKEAGTSSPCNIWVARPPALVLRTARAVIAPMIEKPAATTGAGRKPPDRSFKGLSLGRLKPSRGWAP